LTLTARPSDVDPGDAESQTVQGFPLAEVLQDLRTALTSRALDERCIALTRQSRAFFQISAAGHEGLLTAAARSLRAGHDWFFPYYRDQPLVLALGMSPVDILLAAVGASSDPSSSGRQLPCHWSDRARHIVTSSSPTGSQCLPAVGCAEAGRYIAHHPQTAGCVAEPDEITYVSLGEGATSEGEFWESINAATLLRLPVLYVVADNGYAISVSRREQSAAPISDLLAGFRDLQVRTVDGTDYFATRRVFADVVAQMRAGGGPALVHATVTRPFSHSSMDEQRRYRLAEDLEREVRSDPIERMAAVLRDAGFLTPEQFEKMRAEVNDAVAAAAQVALAAPRPAPIDAERNILALPELVSGDDAAATHQGEPLMFGAAITRVLEECMALDDRIRVFGEDVADADPAVLEQVEGKGGVFGTTKGLQRKFGSDRCFNTPLAEAAIVGRAIGQGIRGLRPCPEIQFFDYIWPAMQQIKSEAATTRWRSDGAWSVPMVLRAPIGGYLSGGAIWHSQSGESIFAHIPGLIVVMPSRARDAVGLLRAAFRAEDPVLFLEHKHLLRQRYTTDPYPPADYVVPFGKGDVRRRGDDLTIVSWGAMVQKSLVAAETLATEGCEIEVIDLRSIQPWDHDIVAESVQRTHRLLVVHEDILTAGFGGEIAAWAAEHLFTDLDAPVLRVGALDCHVPYAPEMEQAVLPQVDDVERAARKILAF
jgi:2-oxoisovalerate dehydrogenase E1 component